jgi:hypothetical protein
MLGLGYIVAVVCVLFLSLRGQIHATFDSELIGQVDPPRRGGGEPHGETNRFVSNLALVKHGQRVSVFGQLTGKVLV